MTVSALFAFLSYSVVCAFTPGPNNLLSLSTAGRYGMKKTRRLLLGLACGILCVMVLCGIFCLSLAAVLPPFVEVMKYVGAAYILWLAWHIATSRPAGEGKETKEPAFLTGFMLQFINVKIILYGVTSLSGFVLPYYTDTGALVFFAVLLALIGSAGNILWASAGALMQKFLRRYYRPFNIAMGLLLVECAISLLMK